MGHLNPTPSQIRQMRRESLAFPVTLKEIPQIEWPTSARIRECFAVWRSRTYFVQAFTEEAGIVRLSVNRTDWDERAKRWREHISWDDLQRLKAEAGYGNRVAIEVFPPDRLIVNVANMRHLWILPAGSERLPFVWRGVNP